MRKIAISYPYFFNGEAAALTSLLVNDGYWRVHIRKPDATEEDMRQLIEQIPADLYPSISIHDHLQLAVEYGLGGIHLNKRNPIIPSGWSGIVSRSLHALSEIGSSEYDYAFLSPIFPSISKPGYCSTFNHEELTGSVNEKIFALGGITPERLNEVADLGFGGAVLHGCLWKARLSKGPFKLQFITHPTVSYTLVQETEMALDGGCRWIQLRNKDANREALITIGKEIAALCQRVGATFIIDDHVELVEAVGADGVHLGKNDMPVEEARRILGPLKIIGATANSFEDIKKAVDAGADYIGLGPFRFTTTKAKLSPILGRNGYVDIINKCRAESVDIPIVAIGGITQDDIADIMRTGVDGIAISSEIINADNPAQKTNSLIKILQSL